MRIVLHAMYAIHPVIISGVTSKWSTRLTLQQIGFRFQFLFTYFGSVSLVVSSVFILRIFLKVNVHESITGTSVLYNNQRLYDLNFILMKMVVTLWLNKPMNRASSFFL